ncbi:gluconokinase [Citreimonas salinaria]|nr:gluconokinase [Citreimonas salinaria]
MQQDGSYPHDPGAWSARSVLVMGVCGTGKSTIGKALAEALGAAFLDADDYHAPDAVARMRRGEPLTDAHRWAWLDRIADAAAAVPGRAVIGCSALKRAYRDRLSARLGPLCIVYLHGDRALVSRRMAGRPDHFMPRSLIDSQFGDLEPPRGADVLRTDIDRPISDIVAEACAFAGGAARRGA